MRKSSILVVLAIAGVMSATRAWALNGTDATNTTDYAFVGRVQDESTPIGSHLGTGSYITNGVVLTAAHCMNEGSSVLEQHFERFEIGGVQYFGLGVQDPLYNPAGLSPDDQGLILLLNAPAAPAGGFPLLGGTNIVNGNTATVVGFTDWTGGTFASNKRKGTVTMSNSAVMVTGSLYNFSKPPSASFTQGGDSGGPLLLGDRIIGTVRSGNSATNTLANAANITSTFVRVDAHMDFITGNGQDIGGGVYQSTLNRLHGTGNTSWSTAASWGRASTNFALAPQATDIAILDPTTASDAGTVVTLDVDTANLNGLLNDVNLKVDGKALNVTGSAGALNGGLIDVGGAAGSAMNLSFSLDNEGTVTIRANGVATLGNAIAATGRETALYNGGSATFAVTGGVLTVAKATDNFGTFNVNSGGSATLGGSMPLFSTNNAGTATFSSLSLINEQTGKITVRDGTLSAATALLNSGNVAIQSNGTVYIGGKLPATLPLGSGNPTAVYNLTNATISIDAGGTLYVTNGASKSALFDNRDGASFLIRGDLTTPSTATVDIVDNSGLTQISTGGVLNITGFAFVNEASGVFKVGGANNARGIGNLGTLFLNAGTTIVTNGGTVISQGQILNVTNSIRVVGGNLYATNGTMSAITDLQRGSLVMDSGLMVSDQILVTNANAQFLLNGGAVTSRFTQVFNGQDFYVGSNAVAASLSLIENSHTFSNGLTIAATANSTGTVNFAANLMTVTNGALLIGWKGTGLMTVTNGTVIAGNLNGPQPVALGGTNGARGTLSVVGGTFTALGPLRAGDSTGATGSIWVTGGTLLATNASTFIGLRGPGQMTVSNGNVWLENTIVGDTNGAPGSLTMDGGTVTTAGSFPGLRIGNLDGATGTVLVTGGSLAVTNGSTVVGNFGSGELTISNVLVRTRDVSIASNLTSRGTLTLNNGTLATTSLFNNTNGVIRGIGTINGPVTSTGSITPGFSAGKLFVTTNLTLQSSSVVIMELGGTADADYDQINATGDLAADGTLSVLLINGFNPTVGNTFDIFDFANSSGQFSTTNLPALFAGLYWDTSQLMTLGEISVAAVPEPATVTLVLGSGVLVFAVRRRRRRKD